MRDVIRFRLPWEPQGVMFFGDPHIDAAAHARQLFIDDLKRCQNDGDIGVIMGDVWSAILPRDLKRYTEGRHGERRDGIINGYIDQAFELLSPYVNCIDVILLGNHETAVIKHHHVDMTALLIDRLNAVKESGKLENGRIAYGGYTCYVQLQFVKSSHSTSNIVWLHHGKGGGAPVTKGMIDANRIMVTRGADVYVIGHKHTSISDQERFEYVDQHGQKKRITRDFIIVGGYSGEEIVDDPDTDYYTLDYSEESFYGLEAQGSARVIFRPHFMTKGYPTITREVIKTS